MTSSLQNPASITTREVAARRAGTLGFLRLGGFAVALSAPSGVLVRHRCGTDLVALPSGEKQPQ